MSYRHAYYSKDLKCWVRMEGPQEDGEFCHTSGFSSYIEAMGIALKMKAQWDVHGMPSFLTDK